MCTDGRDVSGNAIVTFASKAINNVKAAVL